MHMQVLIFSDTHDNVWNMQKLLNTVNGTIDAAIFAGDACAPFMAEYFSQLEVPVYACLGNNDEDQMGLERLSDDNVHWTFLAQEYGQTTIDEVGIAFCHYPQLGSLLAEQGEYDVVVHGHTHESYHKMIGKTLLVNPGAVCGIQSGRPGIASYALYNTETHGLEIKEL